MTKPKRTYPLGVPCWVDVEVPDVNAGQRFYEGLFGWKCHNAMPPEADAVYLLADLDGQVAGAIAMNDSAPSWNTYISVDDCDTSAERVVSEGGKVHSGPMDVGPAGRTAVCTDPGGAPFRLWQANKRQGVDVVNAPNAWNFSNLQCSNPDEALAFYQAVFGWTSIGADPALGIMVAVPGYGHHLESTVDPDIRVRQKFAPEGFADVIGGIKKSRDGEDRWHVKFTVAGRDDSCRKVEELGGSVLSHTETQWTKEALVRDSQGVQFSLSQFAPQY